MATQVTSLVISVKQMPGGVFGTTTTPGNKDSQKITGTTALPSKAAQFPGQRYSLLITGDDVYLSFITTSGTAAATTDLFVANGSLVEWFPEKGVTDVVSILHVAGTYTCWLWMSGGPP